MRCEIIHSWPGSRAGKLAGAEQETKTTFFRKALDEKSWESRSRVCTALAKTGMPLFVLGHFLGLSLVQDSRVVLTYLGT